MVQPQNSIATRFQRNILSKLSTPGLVKHVISDSYSTLLDVMYTVLCHYYPEKVAEKVNLKRNFDYKFNATIFWKL
jgi:hypothetical protein